MNTLKQLQKLFQLTRQVGGVGGARRLLQDGPKHAFLFKRLLTDPRVPLLPKAVLVGGTVFVLSPLDIPNWVPFVGAMTDIGLIMFLGNLFLKQVPAHVMDEHRQAVGLDARSNDAA